MAYDRHFETMRTSGKPEAERLATLLADLHRDAQHLEIDIDAELDRARCRNPSQSEYPLMARVLATRRSNLKATIAALEGRLADQLPALLLV